MGLVVRRLPDDLWRDLGLLFQGRITPFGELIESPSRRSSQIIYATPGLPPDHPNAAVLKVGMTGGVNFTVGGDYARHGDRPDMGGEIKRGARAFRNFIQENPNVYYNNPFMPDGFGENRARFYSKQGFVDAPDGPSGGRMVLDSRIYAPFEDQQAYAHLNRYLVPDLFAPLAAKSRTVLSKGKTDPWLSIPEPQVYDSSGARIDIPSGAFGTLARAAVDKESKRKAAAELLALSTPAPPPSPRFRPGVVDFPEIVYGSPTNRGLVNGAPATWVVPRDASFATTPSYAAPVPIANPFDVTPARRQELARLGYSDPSEWFFQYYNVPESKLEYFQGNNLLSVNNDSVPSWVANNNAWERR
mgnify:CR=1 FL=1